MLFFSIHPPDIRNEPLDSPSFTLSNPGAMTATLTHHAFPDMMARHHQNDLPSRYITIPPCFCFCFLRLALEDVRTTRDYRQPKDVKRTFHCAQTRPMALDFLAGGRRTSINLCYLHSLPELAVTWIGKVWARLRGWTHDYQSCRLPWLHHWLARSIFR